MSIMRFAAKRDANEAEIVAALEDKGCLVQALDEGCGVPDLLVFSPVLRELILIEVKVKKNRRRKDKTAKTQSEFRGKWRAAGAKIAVVIDVKEAIDAISGKGIL